MTTICTNCQPSINLDVAVRMSEQQRAADTEEILRLKKCCTQQKARLQILREFMRETDWLLFCRENEDAHDWFDETL